MRLCDQGLLYPSVWKNGARSQKKYPNLKGGESHGHSSCDPHAYVHQRRPMALSNIHMTYQDDGLCVTDKETPHFHIQT